MSTSAIAELLSIDASGHRPATTQATFKMGTGDSPDHHAIGVNATSLLLDGKPWLPVMGEFHFSRYPANEWRDELLKMKAGGVDTVASYLFWIHHEEIQGQWDWTGQRDLRTFVKLCGECGLKVVLRAGPWAHGEARNGGFPDWLVHDPKIKVRTDQPEYLDHVRQWYGQIGQQIHGLLWKDGGPVIGIQLDNEFSGPAEHLLTLKQIAREAGIDVPIYTRTGWPPLATPMPWGKILPLYGAYAEGFWEHELDPMPPGYWNGFAFSPAGNETTAIVDGQTIQQYPYLTCELGGGMEASYHRRIRLSPNDVASMSLVKVGSGSNLPGYYVYHGGTNPDGKLTTMMESQASGYPNDLPVKRYDYQAPLGEFGQVRPHYHLLRREHRFLQDFGSQLATMPAWFPDHRPADGKDTSTVRWSVRSDGESGFIFVNNYQRLQPMPAKPGVQFEVKLAGGAMRIPDHPIDLPKDSFFFWPFNLDLAGAKLIYATAQPICKIEDDGGATDFVFAQTPGVPTEFVFDASTAAIVSANGKTVIASGVARISNLLPGTSAAINLLTIGARSIRIMLLDEPTSLACWKGEFAGRERVFLSAANLIIEPNMVRLRADDPAKLNVSILPNTGLRTGWLVGEDGQFNFYSSEVEPRPRPRIVIEQIKPPGEARVVPKSKIGVAIQPTDAEFAQAGVWRISFPDHIDPSRDLLLRIPFTGDVARIELDGKLLTDNFYNGDPFEIGLKRFAPDIYTKPLLLKILPLRKDAPIYLRPEVWSDFGSAGSVCEVNGIKLVEQYEATMKLK